MKKLSIFIVALVSVLHSFAFPLSKEAKISVLTCSPGAELYSLFGHTAIRVSDPNQHFDFVFNFGTFDFDTPGFYLKYAQGLLPYQLAVSSYPAFLSAYRRENRTVYSQTLNLDSLEKQTLFDLLLENYQPENRSYLYNFLYDNCTTRSRDIVQKSLPNPISWQLANTDKNFWNLLDEYLSVSPWVKWGIHTILGQPGTQKATTFEYMFLPDYLMYGLDSSTYNGKPLAEKTEILYRATPLPIHTPWYFSPWFIFGLGVVLLILLLQKQKSTTLLNSVTFLFFLFTGIVGALIVFLGFFTEHPITAPNWNILWANPLNLIAAGFVFYRRLPRIIQGYLTLYLLLLAIAIPVWFLAQPAVPLASLPFIFIMIYLCFRQKQKQKRNSPNLRK